MLGNFLSRLIARFVAVVIFGVGKGVPLSGLALWTLRYVCVTFDGAEGARECRELFVENKTGAPMRLRRSH